jgi:hypothetical protein
MRPLLSFGSADEKEKSTHEATRRLYGLSTVATGSFSSKKRPKLGQFFVRGNIVRRE